jgi:hypothetical protein
VGWVWDSLSLRCRRASLTPWVAPEGQASGAYNSIRELGGVFGIAIPGAVFQHIVTLPTVGSFVDGFRTAVFAGAGIVTVGVLISILLPGRTRELARARESAVEAAA